MAGTDRLTWTPRGRTVALGGAIAASLMVHGGLLSFTRSHGSPAVEAAGMSHPMAMATRLLSVAPPSTTVPAPPGNAPAPMAPHTALAPPSPAHDSQPSGDAPAPAAVPPPSRVDDGLDEYLPRRALTRGPVADANVFVPYPEGVPYGHWLLTLTLFIDAQGQVQHVRIAEADLPPVLEAAARQAFLQATYRPGEVDGQPVKSRIRIEIEFSAESKPTRGP